MMTGPDAASVADAARFVGVGRKAIYKRLDIERKAAGGTGAD